MSVTVIRLLFYLVWFTGAIVQAYYSVIAPDEAYYWMFSNRMAWGYFDHPPVIAFLIKVGYSAFENELGVRLLPVLFSTASIYILERILKPKNLTIFFLLISSVGILHFIGFTAIPDSPLLFFFVIFLLLYKKFLKASSLGLSVALGVVMALMCLSKYHGVLLIGLVVISNLRLLKEKYAWVSILVASVVLFPHLLWQISFDFPSLSYHLFERSSEDYKLSHTLEYLVGQLFVLGPLTGLLFFISCYKMKSSNQFEKTMKFLFWGGYVFFLIMSFKGRVEPHWTLYAVMPGMYFGYRYVESLKRSTSIVSIICFASLMLIIPVRVLVVVESPMDRVWGFKSLLKKYRLKNDMLLIEDVAEGKPVAFMNSYQKASVYGFYTNKESFSLNNDAGRRNQFNIWHSEEEFRGRTVTIVPNYDEGYFTTLPKASRLTRYIHMDNFQNFYNLTIELIKPPEVVLELDTLNIAIRLTSPINYTDHISSNREMPTYLQVWINQKESEFSSFRKIKVAKEMLSERTLVSVEIPRESGEYELELNLKTGWFPPSKKSVKHSFVIKNESDLKE